MTPAAIIAAARDLGVSLVPEGEHIRIRPSGRLPATLRAAVTTQKPALLAILRSIQPADACNLCGSASWIVSLVDDAGRRTCLACVTGQTAMRKAGVPL